MPQATEELPDVVVEKARQFINLRQGKNAEKGWAASALLDWIAEAEIDEAETALSSITGAPFAQAAAQDPDSDDYRDTNWIAVLRAMEDRGLRRAGLLAHLGLN